ncbi:hypothetical protein BDN70DRAFT_547313 [Pholiota conissans]|uniref:Uncharacterized protein n=1 Tax=Pholiota conissans TaxID=109636 RepID=A0A9P5YN89_9AGAR|nr:hypothetical protein BDN70DRAFT_547313 [Pholiota conissans]
MNNLSSFLPSQSLDGVRVVDAQQKTRSVYPGQHQKRARLAAGLASHHDEMLLGYSSMHLRRRASQASASESEEHACVRAEVIHEFSQLNTLPALPGLIHVLALTTLSVLKTLMMRVIAFRIAMMPALHG